jgi:hypothetical protein
MRLAKVARSKSKSAAKSRQDGICKIESAFAADDCGFYGPE